MSKAKLKPIEGRLHPVDATKLFKVDFDLLTEDFNNIVLEDVIKRIKGKSVDTQQPTFIKPAMSPGPQSYMARDGRDIKSKAPSLLREYIVPQLNGEKLAEIVRELEALFDDATMPLATISRSKSDVYHPYEHNYGGSEYFDLHAQTPIFVKPEYTTLIHLVALSPIIRQPHFQDPQQGPVEPIFILPAHGNQPHVSLSPTPPRQSNMFVSQASGSSTQAGTVETLPPFTILSLPPSSPQPGYAVNPPLSPQMSAPPTGTASGLNEQQFVYSIPVLFHVKKLMVG
ncbi:hypothetical protein BDN71DRAFT_1502316 [Pleurotus eryngii]|uniref:Uncharacterized protein n=1 Tax=Pleurotus eryngii TaxID=5323 RepID=A0A9P6DJB0_PLEER|nr:hypothetical protein BDN71DRAFT_1502316 [Pleurotus eryngii]